MVKCEHRRLHAGEGGYQDVHHQDINVGSEHGPNQDTHDDQARSAALRDLTREPIFAQLINQYLSDKPRLLSDAHNLVAHVSGVSINYVVLFRNLSAA